MGCKGCNKSGRFLVAAVFAEGGRRGGIWFLEGREGWGWRCIVGELRKFMGFLAAERPMASGVKSGEGFFLARSFFCGCLRAERRFSSFSGPRLGSRPKFLCAALEPCLGLSAGIGSWSGFGF
jgi:hypothetical protein